MRRVLCWLFGHQEAVSWWEAWRENPEIGRHRIIRDVCPRCEDVLGLRSEVEGEPWTP